MTKICFSTISSKLCRQKILASKTPMSADLADKENLIC